MDTSNLGLSADQIDLLQLGADLGQSDSFTEVAGYCSAARAATFVRLKEQRTYKSLNLTWDDFCPAVLHLSRSEVDKQIALFAEFGPRYFAVASLAPVSPETYRLLEPSLEQNALLLDGRSIPLDRENAPKVASAVAELRRRARDAKAPPPPTLDDEVKLLGGNMRLLIAECREIAPRVRECDAPSQFLAIVTAAVSALALIQAETTQ